MLSTVLNMNQHARRILWVDEAAEAIGNYYIKIFSIFSGLIMKREYLLEIEIPFFY